LAGLFPQALLEKTIEIKAFVSLACNPFPKIPFIRLNDFLNISIPVRSLVVKDTIKLGSKTSEVYLDKPWETSEVGWSIVGKIFPFIDPITGCPRRALLVRGLPLRLPSGAPARRIVTAGGSPQPRPAYKHELVAYIT